MLNPSPATPPAPPKPPARPARAYTILFWFLVLGQVLATFTALMAVGTLLVTARPVMRWRIPLPPPAAVTPVDPSGWQTYRNDQSDFSNLFSAENVKVGDTIAGMTVKSVSPFFKDRSDQPIGIENAKIAFVGQATVTGQYHYYNDNVGFFYDTVCFDSLDPASQLKIPTLYNEYTDIGASLSYRRFCFSNQEFAKTEFTPQDSSGIATITIDNYQVEGCGCETVDQTQLVRVEEIKLNTTAWQTYRNEELGFEFQYPPSWQVEEHFFSGDEPPESTYISVSLNGKSFVVNPFGSLGPEPERDPSVRDGVVAGLAAKIYGWYIPFVQPPLRARQDIHFNKFGYFFLSMGHTLSSEAELNQPSTFFELESILSTFRFLRSNPVEPMPKSK